jgi:hypothetical protein
MIDPSAIAGLADERDHQSVRPAGIHARGFADDADGGGGVTVSYTKEQRDRSKAEGWPLTTLAIPGMEFQGPVLPEERDEISAFMVAFLKRRTERLRQRNATPPSGRGGG